MNKDEIKKAFDICFSAQKSCNGCPLLVLEKQNGRGCKYNMFTSVFDIITEQEEEIEQLKSECEYRKKQHDSQVSENTRLYIEYGKAFERLKAQQREIERLKDDYAKLQELFAQYQMASDKEMIAQKKEAVKEFAEKVKEKYSLYDDRHILYRIIDELLKEYKE